MMNNDFIENEISLESNTDGNNEDFNEEVLTMKHEFSSQLHENFDAIHWVASMKKPKDDRRNYVNYLHVIDGKLVSTNGAWLQEVEADLPDGRYEVLKAIKSKVILLKVDDVTDEFPDYLHLLEPTETGYEDNSVEVDGTELDKGFAKVIRSMDANSFNIEMYSALVRDHKFTAHVDRYGQSPVVFHNDNKRAALMPAIVS